MTENELLEYIDGIGNQCRKNRLLHHACFEIVFAQIGNPLSRVFMMNQLVSGKAVKIWDKDEFCGRKDMSPDHNTNITASVIDAFSRLYEL